MKQNKNHKNLLLKNERSITRTVYVKSRDAQQKQLTNIFHLSVVNHFNNINLSMTKEETHNYKYIYIIVCVIP